MELYLSNSKPCVGSGGVAAAEEEEEESSPEASSSWHFSKA